MSGQQQISAALVRRSMVEAGKQFRRVNDYLHLRTLRDTLNRVTGTVGTTGHDETVNAA